MTHGGVRWFRLSAGLQSNTARWSVKSKAPVHAGGFLPRIVSIFDCGHAERVKGMVRPGACRSPLTARRAADRSHVIPIDARRVFLACEFVRDK